jgi:hypothetical protein
VALGAALLSSCSAPAPQPKTFGTVAGALQLARGSRDTPLPGTVTFTSGSGRQYTVRVPDDGRFRLRVPTGTYTANGGSPDVRVRNATKAEVRCYDYHFVHVTTGTTTRTAVTCVPGPR